MKNLELRDLISGLIALIMIATATGHFADLSAFARKEAGKPMQNLPVFFRNHQIFSVTVDAVLRGNLAVVTNVSCEKVHVERPPVIERKHELSVAALDALHFTGCCPQNVFCCNGHPLFLVVFVHGNHFLSVTCALRKCKLSSPSDDVDNTKLLMNRFESVCQTHGNHQQHSLAPLFGDRNNINKCRKVRESGH